MQLQLHVAIQGQFFQTTRHGLSCTLRFIDDFAGFLKLLLRFLNRKLSASRKYATNGSTPFSLVRG